MEGNAKIIRLIARDEALYSDRHATYAELKRSGVDDPRLAEIAEERKQECYDLFGAGGAAGKSGRTICSATVR